MHWRKREGSILVFLPGAGEIERVKQALLALKLGQDILIAPLIWHDEGRGAGFSDQACAKGQA